MSEKEKRSELLKAFIERLQNDEHVDHDEPKTDILIKFVKDFSDKYDAEDLNEMAARELIYPFFYVFSGKLGLHNKEVMLTSSEQYINKLLVALMTPLFKEDEAWKEDLLINIPEKMLETGNFDKAMFAEHLEMVKHERTRIDGMRSTLDAIRRFVAMMGLQPEIPVVLGLPETYGEKADEVNKFLASLKKA